MFETDFTGNSVGLFLGADSSKKSQCFQLSVVFHALASSLPGQLFLTICLVKPHYNASCWVSRITGRFVILSCTFELRWDAVVLSYQFDFDVSARGVWVGCLWSRKWL